MKKLLLFSLMLMCLFLFPGCAFQEWLNSSHIAGFGEREVRIESQFDAPATVYMDNRRCSEPLTKEQPFVFIEEWYKTNSLLFQVIVDDQSGTFSLIFKCPGQKREINERPEKICFLLTTNRQVIRTR